MVTPKKFTPEHHVYDQYKVRERDLAAFCKAFGLSEHAMLQVARGERFSHKNWIQGYTPGNLGKRFTGDPRACGIAISGLRKGYEPVPNNPGGNVFNPSVWWTPAE